MSDDLEVTFEKYEPKWISISERYPEKKKSILYVAVSGSNKKIIMGSFENGIWKSNYMFYGSAPFTHDVLVTHWMELPEYPEMETESL